MEYVMVPVPEDLADRVLQYISWKRSPHDVSGSDRSAHTGRAAAQDANEVGDDGGPLARVFASLDDTSRELLAMVAATSLDQDLRSIPEVARQVGTSVREAIGTTTEVNNLIVDEGGPPLSITVVERPGASYANFTWKDHAFLMPEPVAREVALLAGLAVET